MGSSGCMGLMAVVAVSSSVALVALTVHKRLVSDFMKKVESELVSKSACRKKKKVRFAADVVEPSSDNKEYRMRRRSRLLAAGGLSPVVGAADMQLLATASC